MNKVSFHNLGPEGKETRLVKYLPKKNIEDYLPTLSGCRRSHCLRNQR